MAATHAAAAAAVGHGSNHRNYCGGLTNNESPSSATDFVVQPAAIGEIRPNLYNELKSENELMQAMVCYIFYNYITTFISLFILINNNFA